MIIKTKYSPGDKVFTFGYNMNRTIFPIPDQMTVGQVRVSVTDSPGIDQSGNDYGIEFDNYKAQKSYEEEYMLVETGIGTGTIHKVENLFETYAEAERFCNDYNSQIQD